MFTNENVYLLYDIIQTWITGDFLEVFYKKILAMDESSLQSIFVQLIIPDMFDVDLKPKITRID